MTTEHLPECPAPLCDWGDPSAECMGYEDCHHLCCCAALRACEQRVREDMALQYLVSDREQQEAEQRAYAAGLEAARDAASKQRSKFKARDWDDAIDAALAAIDALRNPPPLPPTTGRAHKY